MQLPGGPNRRHPFGGLIPTLWNSSGFVNGSSITCRKPHTYRSLIDWLTVDIYDCKWYTLHNYVVV